MTTPPKTKPPEMIAREAYGELFDAAQVVLGWMKQIPPRDRPIAKFNRLQDSIGAVREAHQMHGFTWPEARAALQDPEDTP